MELPVPPDLFGLTEATSNAGVWAFSPIPRNSRAHTSLIPRFTQAYSDKFHQAVQSAHDEIACHAAGACRWPVRRDERRIEGASAPDGNGFRQNAGRPRSGRF